MLRMSVQLNVYLGWIVFMAGGLLLGRALRRGGGRAMMLNPILKTTLRWAGYVAVALLISAALLSFGLVQVPPAY